MSSSMRINGDDVVPNRRQNASNGVMAAIRTVSALIAGLVAMVTQSRDEMNHNHDRLIERFNTLNNLWSRTQLHSNARFEALDKRLDNKIEELLVLAKKVEDRHLEQMKSMEDWMNQPTTSPAWADDLNYEAGSASGIQVPNNSMQDDLDAIELQLLNNTDDPMEG